MEREDAITSLIARAQNRAKRLRTLADDPYAGGTEREDAELLERLSSVIASLIGGRPDHEAIRCHECDQEVPDNGDLICCDCVRELQNTVKSIATMLGWGNVPPRETLERDINVLKARALPPVAEPRTADSQNGKSKS